MTFAEQLGSLEGSHDVLSVKAADLKRGDVLIQGACFRTLVAPKRHICGYLEWEVARSLEGPVLGTWQLRDDGVARVTVLRKREPVTSGGWYPCCGSTGACTCPPEGGR